MEWIIENEILRVTVNGHGAEMTSVCKKETGEELLWTADPSVWGRHAPLLFPYCGKLKDGRYTHKGTVYEGGGHGFARDMDYVLEEKTQDSITLKLEANALTMEKYPFAFRLLVTYQLDGSTVRHKVSVANDGEEEMPFGIGFHPAFLCPFDAQHKAEDYVVRFSQPETPTQIMTGQTDGLVTGEKAVYFEQQTEIPMSDEIFARDSICFTDLKSARMSLVEKDTGKAVNVEVTGFPYVLLWSAAGPLHFVCIEPWMSLPDARDADGEWTHKPCAAVLTEGEQYEVTLSMEFAR